MTMKTHRMVSLVFIFPFLAGLLSVHGPNTPTAFAQETGSGEATPEPPDGSESRGQHTCPVIPIAVYGGGALYEAYYYETDECNPPSITYVYGEFGYPQTCPICSARKDDSPQDFYGLAMPVPADYEHKMPAGRPRTYSKKVLTPDRIRHLYLVKSGVYVRVFSFQVNRADMKSGVEPDDANFKETFHFAFECSDPTTIGADPAQIKEIDANNQKEVPNPGTALGTVYDVTYKPAGGGADVHILTFICGDPVPPVDLPKPAATGQ